MKDRSGLLNRLKKNSEDANVEMKEVMDNLYNEGHPNQNYRKKIDVAQISANMNSDLDLV